MGAKDIPEAGSLFTPRSGKQRAAWPYDPFAPLPFASRTGGMLAWHRSAGAMTRSTGRAILERQVDEVRGWGDLGRVGVRRQRLAARLAAG